MIKIGDFIRTKDGYIGKVERIITTEGGYYCCDTVKGSSYKNDIKKHSTNIIDLVEVGDIVEIIDVLNVDIHYIWNESMLNAINEDVKNGLNLGRILTKEQFKANCYKVGGEDE